jgi:putative FmdB family regulatory protein
MPTYEYLCTQCGRFDQRRPLSESALPGVCPGCGKDAPRALSAPYVGAAATAGGGYGGGNAGGGSGGGCGSGGCGHMH